MITAFPGRKRTDLKERTQEAITDLEMEVKAMYSLRTRLQSSVNDALSSAMRSYNREGLTHNTEEYDELANLLNIVRSAEILLQNISVKIDSARYLQELVRILDRAMVSMRAIRSDMSSLMPAINTKLNTITGSIIEIRSDLKIEERLENGLACDELPAVVMPREAVELPALMMKPGPVKENTVDTAKEILCDV